MNTVLDIGRLSHTEKLRAMEELWDDLSRSQDEYPSPGWHGEVLRAREEALAAGRDAFVPWEEAKAILRAKTK
jgi:putative addiction module component (TIGR02574 family)